VKQPPSRAFHTCVPAHRFALPLRLAHLVARKHILHQRGLRLPKEVSINECVVALKLPNAPFQKMLQQSFDRFYSRHVNIGLVFSTPMNKAKQASQRM